MDESIYSPPIAQLLSYGDCRQIRGWPDYLALGLGPEHVPELIRMATDKRLHWADPDDGHKVWAPVHAWRTLGQLRAEAAIEPLVNLFGLLDEEIENWIADELPEVFGLIGPAALPRLGSWLADPSNGERSCIAATVSIAAVGLKHVESRDRCVAMLTRRLEAFRRDDAIFNGVLIACLLDLKAVEAAPLIERAFAAECVDPTIAGDWNEVAKELGVALPPDTEAPAEDTVVVLHGSGPEFVSDPEEIARQRGQEKRRTRKKEQRKRVKQLRRQQKKRKKKKR